MRIKLLFIFLIVLPAGLFAQQKTDSTKPFTLGKTVYIKSAILGEERALNIYLPDGYSDNDTTHYPVVYLLDGSADEDFIHVVGLYYFNSFPWVNRIPKSIIVGIANVDRKRDFTFPSTQKDEQERFKTSGHSTFFILFLANELQPYIEKNYRTTSDKTIIGESLGGLLATEILLKRPTLFTTYIIISPSLWWSDGSLLSDTIVTKSILTTFVYIGVGKEGLTPSKKPHVQEVDANLLAEKLKALKNRGMNIFFDYMPDEDHATIGEHALFNALKWLSTSSTNK